MTFNNNEIQLAIAAGTMFAAVIAFVMGIITTRNLSKQLKLTTFSDYTKRYQEITLNFPENINEEDFDFEKLTPDIKNKTFRYMRAYFDLCSEEYYLWKEGNLDDNVWEKWESGIKYALSKTAFKNGWQYINKTTQHYDDFGKFVNNIIEGNHQLSNKSSFEKHKDKLFILLNILILGLIAWLGFDLYQQGISIGVDWKFAIIGFWIASLILLLAMKSNNKNIQVIRNIFIFILASISIYVSMGLKFDIEQIKKNMPIKTTKHSSE
jgi:hypothetical protein